VASTLFFWVGGKPARSRMEGVPQRGLDVNRLVSKEKKTTSKGERNKKIAKKGEDEEWL